MNFEMIFKFDCIKNKIKKELCNSLNNIGLKNLCSSHGMILLELHKSESGHLTMKSIANKIKRTKSTVSDLINRLEEEQLIERKQCKNDHRITYIQLTDLGSIKAKEYFAQLTQLNSEIFAGISEDEHWFIARLIQRISSNLDIISSTSDKEV